MGCNECWVRLAVIVGVFALVAAVLVAKLDTSLVGLFVGLGSAALAGGGNGQ